MATACLDGLACHPLADLTALDPTIRVQVGTVHAAEGMEARPNVPSLWIWSTANRFAPRHFHEATLDASIEAARSFLERRLATSTPLRSRDEAEGGIIIPDYMY